MDKDWGLFLQSQILDNVSESQHRSDVGGSLFVWPGFVVEMSDCPSFSTLYFLSNVAERKLKSVIFIFVEFIIFGKQNV